MDAREQRGLEIAAVAKIVKTGDTYIVPSQAGANRYVVQPGETPKCTCPDFELRGVKCKHIFAVECVIKRETEPDGSVTVTQTVRVTKTVKTTYPQNWPAYNAAQTSEKHHFQRLLHDLCRGMQWQTETGGRPRKPLPDVLFAVTFKVYSTVSGRRFIADLDDAHAKGYISEVPHFNTIFNHLETPELTPILTALITRAAGPLKSVETAFAVDSSGFATSRFVRWFDHKYGIVRQEHDWVKAHLMCGVKTNVVTAIEIHGKNAHDAPVMPALVGATAKAFDVREVSGDKGYSSLANMEAVAAVGGTPFIAFKSSATGAAGGLFEKMFHYFNFNREDFLSHYHKRSNVESTFSMIKAKFGDAVRSKTDTAMNNEVLCKVLCHNLACLIQSMYELGIEPTFAKWSA